MSTFYYSIIHNFLVSFGVVMGASVFSGLGALITNNPPYKYMVDVANSMKIWAIAAALGGTFSSFSVIEKGLFEGEVRSIIKQSILVLIAMFGSNVAYNLIVLIQRCTELWQK